MTAQPERSPSPLPEEAGATGPLSFLRRSDVARALPFALYMVFIAIADGLSRLGVSDDALRWLYPVKIGIVLVALIAYRRHYAEMAAHRLSFGVAVASVATGVAVLVLWVNLDAGWMVVGTSAGFNPTGADGRIDWQLVAIRTAGAALIVPVMEELFWRSFLLRWMVRPQFLTVHPGQVGLVPLVVTSVLFGVEHNQWFAGLVAGIAYGLLYMRTGSIWAPILAHGVTNALLAGWVLSTATWTYW